MAKTYYEITISRASEEECKKFGVPEIGHTKPDIYELFDTNVELQDSFVRIADRPEYLKCDELGGEYISLSYAFFSDAKDDMRNLEYYLESYGYRYEYSNRKRTLIAMIYTDIVKIELTKQEYVDLL